jgi:hypothetical protein
MNKRRAVTEIRRWKTYFEVLNDWNIYYDKDSEFKCQVNINKKDKTAIIFECKKWNGEKVSTERYIFHEMLHIAYRASKGSHKREEIFIQDLCELYYYEDD